MSYHHNGSNTIFDSVQWGRGAFVGFFFHSHLLIDSKVTRVTNVGFALSGCHSICICPIIPFFAPRSTIPVLGP